MFPVPLKISMIKKAKEAHNFRTKKICSEPKLANPRRKDERPAALPMIRLFRSTTLLGYRREPKVQPRRILSRMSSNGDFSINLLITLLSSRC